MAHQGMPGSFLNTNQSNGKDMFDCFINIYADTELADWL